MNDNTNAMKFENNDKEKHGFTKFWLYFGLTTVLKLGVLFLACTNPIDKSLNGIWDNIDRDSRYIFNNGAFQFFLGDFVTMREIYNTNSGRIDMKVTHIHGSIYDLENRFYMTSELESTSLESWQRGELQQMIEQGHGSYSVIGNRLTIIFDMEEIGRAYFTKKIIW